MRGRGTAIKVRQVWITRAISLNRMDKATKSCICQCQVSWPRPTGQTLGGGIQEGKTTTNKRQLTANMQRKFDEKQPLKNSDCHWKYGDKPPNKCLKANKKPKTAQKSQIGHHKNAKPQTNKSDRIKSNTPSQGFLPTTASGYRFLLSIERTDIFLLIRLLFCEARLVTKLWWWAG